MTIEEKAKRYDEALERAKRLTSDMTTLQKIREFIFPELAESEDERIRKSLIKFLTAIKIISESGRTTWAVRKEDAERCKSFLAYLERQKEPENTSASTMAPSCLEVKQKEQKEETLRDFIDNFPYSAEQKEQDWNKKPCLTCQEYEKGHKQGYTEGCTAGYNKAMKEFEQKEQNGEDGFLEDELSAFLQNYDKEYDDDAAVSDVARHFYEIGKKQNEQKPNYCLYGGDPNVGRCRWCYAACNARLADVHTDEEKEYIRTIKSIISDFIRDKKPKNLAYYQRIYDWLDGRHVPFSCGHENGAKWSEKDEDMLNSCISSIEEAKENRYAYKETDGDTSYDHEIAWLKSIRPSWKPSKEQMDSLRDTIANTKGYSYSIYLPDLYEQLKKL